MKKTFHLVLAFLLFAQTVFLARGGENSPTPLTPPPTSASAAREFLISAPPPEYPYEALTRITGAGVCVITVDFETGSVIDAKMDPGTGSSILDNVTTSAFKRWRFKPRTVSTVRWPITFTINGAKY